MDSIYAKAINCYFVAFEIKKATNRLKYFIYHLLRCNKQSDTAKLLVMSLSTTKYLSDLIVLLNSWVKDTVDTLLPKRIPYTGQLLLTQIAESNLRKLAN